MKFTILLASLVFANGSWAAPALKISAKVTEKGSDGQKSLYLYEHFEDVDGSKTLYNNQFKDLNGELVVKEEVVLENGGVKTFSVEQKQLGETGKIEVKDGKVFFDYERDGKKEKQASEKLADNFVIGPTLVSYVQKNWDKITKDEDTIHMRFGVADRQETVGFKIFKYEEKKEGDKDLIVMKMKASSFVIAALVDPLYFYFDKNTKKLMKLDGRTLPKMKKNGKWEDLDAVSLYQHY